MPVDELKELGLKLKAARKEKGLTRRNWRTSAMFPQSRSRILREGK